MAAEHGFATRQPGATLCYGGGEMEPHNSPAFDEFTDIKCDGDVGVMRSAQPLARLPHLYVDYSFHTD